MRMSDLHWNDVKEFFDPSLMGTLPDLVVPGSSVDDWQALLHLIEERGWQHQYFEGTSMGPMPRAETVLSRSAEAECAQLKVWPNPQFLVIFRFDSADAIDFDVDLRELQGQDRLDLFCEFLASVGRRLGKAVLMDAEGGASSHPVLGYSVTHDRVVKMTDPPQR